MQSTTPLNHIVSMIRPFLSQLTSRFSRFTTLTLMSQHKVITKNRFRKFAFHQTRAADAQSRIVCQVTVRSAGELEKFPVPFNEASSRLSFSSFRCSDLASLPLSLHPQKLQRQSASFIEMRAQGKREPLPLSPSQQTETAINKRFREMV